MKKIVIFLDDREEEVLNALIKRYGGKAPAIIKEALKFRFDKAFPAYNVKTGGGLSILGAPAEPEIKIMTQPEICEYFGGTVDKKHLIGPVCLGMTLPDKSRRNVLLKELGHVGKYGDLTVPGYEVKDEYSI